MTHVRNCVIGATPMKTGLGLPGTKIVKGIDYCPVEIIKGLTDKGQFQYLANLKGHQVGNYLYTTQFRSLR